MPTLRLLEAHHPGLLEVVSGFNSLRKCGLLASFEVPKPLLVASNVVKLDFIAAIG